MHTSRLVLLMIALSGLAACRQHDAADARKAEPSAQPGIDVEELALVDAQRSLADGTVSVRDLTRAYLDRIAALDDAGPMLNAVIELNPQALADADRLDAERTAGQLRGPLHGIPVLLKDNIDAVGMVTSAGSLALAEHRPVQDAVLVRRLRDAGAVILGKTNLSEWANFRSTHSISGWSSRGGQTRNPYALDRNPCGSSSGTGSAIAASLAMLGVGTETDGSIICPASVNGLVGLKPTVGLISRSGIIPISESQDTAGPMTRSVAEAAALLTVLAGPDAHDTASPKDAARFGLDYLQALQPDALRGARLGVLRQAMGYLPAVDAQAELAYASLRAQGAILVDVELKTWGSWDDAEFEVLLYEFKDGLNRYLATRSAPPQSLESLIQWNADHALQAMPWFGQELLLNAQAKGPLSEAAYLEARQKARRAAGEDGLLALLKAHQLEALIAPSTAPAWLTDRVLGDHYVGGGYSIAAVAGTPSITVPMGDVQGLPVGLVFMAPAFEESRLIALAYGFEQAVAARRRPEYRASVE